MHANSVPLCVNMGDSVVLTRQGAGSDVWWEPRPITLAAYQPYWSPAYARWWMSAEALTGDPFAACPTYKWSYPTYKRSKSARLSSGGRWRCAAVEGGGRCVSSALGEPLPWRAVWFLRCGTVCLLLDSMQAASAWPLAADPWLALFSRWMTERVAPAACDSRDGESGSSGCCGV